MLACVLPPIPWLLPSWSKANCLLPRQAPIDLAMCPPLLPRMFCVTWAASPLQCWMQRGEPPLQTRPRRVQWASNQQCWALVTMGALSPCSGVVACQKQTFLPLLRLPGRQGGTGLSRRLLPAQLDRAKAATQRNKMQDRKLPMVAVGMTRRRLQWHQDSC